jgi:hypothetical protein
MQCPTDHLISCRIKFQRSEQACSCPSSSVSFGFKSNEIKATVRIEEKVLYKVVGVLIVLLAHDLCRVKVRKKKLCAMSSVLDKLSNLALVICRVKFVKRKVAAPRRRWISLVWQLTWQLVSALVVIAGERAKNIKTGGLKKC